MIKANSYDKVRQLLYQDEVISVESEKETTKHEETKKILLAPRAHFLFFSKLEYLASVGSFSQ